MPVDFTLPPDTRAVGTGNPPQDMDNVVDALTAMGGGSNVLNAAFAGGADPTGTSDSSAAFNAALTALISGGGGTLQVPAGTYRLNSAVTANISSASMMVLIQGAGHQSTVLNSYVTGDCLRMYAPAWSGTNYAQGSGVRGLTIDGTNAGAGSNGLHAGDINALRLDCQIRNFTGAGSIGLAMENTVTWTEQADVRALLVNNTTAVQFSKSGTGTNSFGYGAWDFTIWPASTAGQNGVIVTGASLYHGWLRIRGNFNSSSSALSNYVFQAISTSSISGARLEITVETPAGANHPTTLNIDGTSTIQGCYGILDFSGGGGTFAPSSLSNGRLSFTGIISGDSGLNPGAPLNQWVFASVATPQVMSAVKNYSGSGFPTTTGDIFSTTLAANLTANMTSTFFNGTKTLGAPQRVTIIIKQGAAGNFTVTWPNPGSPTTGTPAIKWAGGTAPTMTATANATDVYNLVTADGITWYGTALQNVS